MSSIRFIYHQISWLLAYSSSNVYTPHLFIYFYFEVGNIPWSSIVKLLTSWWNAPEKLFFIWLYGRTLHGERLISGRNRIVSLWTSWRTHRVVQSRARRSKPNPKHFPSQSNKTDTVRGCGMGEKVQKWEGKEMTAVMRNTLWSLRGDCVCRRGMNSQRRRRFRNSYELEPEKEKKKILGNKLH